MLLLTGAAAYGAIYSSYNSGTLNTTIPDGDPNGISSTINVSGSGGLRVVAVQVFLEVSGGYNGDLDAYLSFGGHAAVLLNRIGKTGSDPFGYDTAGFGDGSHTFNNGGTWYSFMLDDAASTDIHTYSGGTSGDPITGAYQPDGRTTDPQLVVDTDARGAPLGSFDSLSPNGDWTLFFADMAGGGGSGSSTLVGWGLEIESVPEPANVALGLCGGIFGIITLWRRRESLIQCLFR